MSDKLPLDARHLSLRDLKRAKAGPLQGRDPYELMPDTLERQTLIAWCARSRDDPEVTWADAEDMTLGDFEWGDQEDDDQPPLTESSDEPGEPAATPKPKPSPARPPAPEPSTSSGPTSASPETSSSS